MTRIKICGITNVDDACYAVDAGADAIGLVFYEPSPRCVSVDVAAEIASALGPFVTLVGLFVNASSETVNKVLKSVPLSLLQFHGDETALFCEQFSPPYMKALRMREDVDVEAFANDYTSAVAILLDAYLPGVPGGTGEQFDWQRVPKQLSKPVVLAGGLTPDNVASAIQTTRPYAVDVSGGVEKQAGIKDHQRILQFIQQTRSARF